METKFIALSLGGNKVSYRIEELPHQADLGQARCPKCGGTLQLVAEVLQWGFWEDAHWYFVICDKCGQPTCYKQEIVLDYEVKDINHE